MCSLYGADVALKCVSRNGRAVYRVSCPSLPAGGEYGGSVGHLLCVCCGSDDETGAESLNLCISDEPSPLFISHHHILQLGKLSLSCQTLVPPAHTGMHVVTLMHKQTHGGTCLAARLHVYAHAHR